MPANDSTPQVPGIGFAVETTVRDALYDRIPLSAPELALIATPAFLRLERIQQLGFVSKIWPGARHTRFEHSLGVLHLARLAIEHLRRANPWIGDEDARTLAAAALLHDIGHYPFSHAIEELGSPVLPHETVGRQLIEDEPIAGILSADWGVDPARVAAIVDPAERTLPEADRVLRGVLSGPLDVDKLDYLPRDARACFVPYGGVDATRLVDAMRIEPVDGERRVAVGSKGVSPLHSLINARQEMFDNVYWHHANRACMSMLLRAVQDALLVAAISAEELTRHDDRSLLARLVGPEMPETTRHLVVALDDRRLHKRAVEISNRAVELYGRLGNLYFDPVARRNVEIALTERLAAAIGEPVTPEAILIDIPKPEKWRTNVVVVHDNPPIGFDRVMSWRDVVGLGDDDFKRYEEHRRLIRIVAAEPFRAAFAKRWETLLQPLIGGLL